MSDGVEYYPVVATLESRIAELDNAIADIEVAIEKNDSILKRQCVNLARMRADRDALRAHIGGLEVL